MSCVVLAGNLERSPEQPKACKVFLFSLAQGADLIHSEREGDALSKPLHKHADCALLHSQKCTRCMDYGADSGNTLPVTQPGLCSQQRHGGTRLCPEQLRASQPALLLWCRLC